MKLKVFAALLAVIGVGTSVAVAKGPPPATPAPERAAKVCHRTASAARPFRLIRVSRSALEAHMRHGDLLAAAGGCSSTTSAAP
jgi:hypothetical protein